MSYTKEEVSEIKANLKQIEEYAKKNYAPRLRKDESVSVEFGEPKTMQTYLDGMRYESQKSKEKQVGVDTASYLLRIDDRAETVHTAADGYWGGVETLYRVIDGETYHDAVVITVEMPEDYDFAAMKALAERCFPNMKQIVKAKHRERGQSER